MPSQAPSTLGYDQLQVASQVLSPTAIQAPNLVTSHMPSPETTPIPASIHYLNENQIRTILVEYRYHPYVL
jgi:hypothetical protein